MAEEINIHVATDLNTDKLPIKTVNNISPDSNGNIEITNATDPNAVHKTGNETINGVKSFGDIIKATNGTVQVGADTGYSVTFNYNGNITSKQARGTYNIFLPENSGTLALTSDIDGKANDSTVVHKTGNETIAGSKTFSNQIYLGAGGASYGQISAKDNNSILRLFGGTSAGTGANLDLCGEGLENGKFSLRARTSNKIIGLDGSTDGTLKWDGKNVALDENLVHRSGNETINGVKYFGSLVYLHNNLSNKNSQMDLFTTPANTLYSHYMFVDKNDEVLAYMQYGQQYTGTDFIGLFIHDKNRALHGIQVTTNNEVIPIKNGVYSLGSITNKWANIYGNLKGNAEIDSLIVNSDTFKHIGSNNGVHYVHTLPKFDGELLGATFVKTNNGWYRKHSDGFIEMGGFTNCANVGGTIVATNLPLAFSNTNYTLMIQLTRNTASGNSWGGDYALPTTRSKTTTRFEVYSNGLGSPGDVGGYDWYACGY